MSKLMVAAAAIVIGLAAASPASSQVHVSVNIGTPPVFVAAPPPPMVVVPGSPVYYAPDYEYGLLFYGGRYYTHFNGGWFWSPRPGATWVAVSTVPRPLLAVPVEYRVKHGRGPGHCPPGQAKKGRC